MKRLVFLVTAFVSMAVAVAACGGSSGPTGTVEVIVKDAPPPGVTKVLVTTKNIQVHKAGAGDDSGWETVIGDEKTFDLVAVSEVAQILGAGTLPVGSYTQVRMDVPKVRVTANGKDFDATVPSDKLKIVGNFNVNANATTSLKLDFQGDQSLVLTGEGKAIFKPVVKLEVANKAPGAKP